jgi:sec-independent protein translocase protein TatC
MVRFRSSSGTMPLAAHLVELRRRFLLCCATIAFLGVVAFAAYAPLLHLLQQPYCHASPHHCQFLVTNPLDGFTLRIKIGLFGGLFFAAPVILWHIWRFITPGLKVGERRYALPFVAAGILFFSFGVVTAYFVFNRALQWLQAVGGNQLITQYNPNQYLSLFLLMMLVFGLSFEFPVVLVGLQLGRIVTPAALLRQWRYAVIGITVVSAGITPSSDWFSMFALAVPLVVFYFLAIVVGKVFRR